MTLRRFVGRRSALAMLLAAGCSLAVLADDPPVKEITPPAKKDAEPAAIAPEDAIKKARVNGKYAMLLRQLKVPGDREPGLEVQEGGLRRVNRYGGHSRLPTGYWVYVYPNWYIWRDLVPVVAAKRPWGPEQMIGSPDTPASGDFGTAWASLSPDSQDEWIMVEFAEPVVPSAIRVHETWNPGAVGKVTLFRLDGTEEDVWEGKDPTSPSKDLGVSDIKLKVDFKTCRALLRIDSQRVRGWNEIDAVGLVDGAGKVQYAIAAEASSTCATNSEMVFQGLLAAQQRLLLLEKELLLLREEVRQLKKGKSEKDK